MAIMKCRYEGNQTMWRIGENIESLKWRLTKAKISASIE
jgi:hypothetical protein